MNRLPVCVYADRSGRSVQILKACSNFDREIDRFQFPDMFCPTVKSTLPDLMAALRADPHAFGIVEISDLDRGAAFATAMRRKYVLKNPLIMLFDDSLSTPEEAASERAVLLAAGADDVQPTSIDRKELLFRMRGLLGRSMDYVDLANLEIPNGRFDAISRRIVGKRSTISLNGSQNTMLRLLVTKAPRVISVDEFSDALYPPVFDVPLAISDRVRVMIHFLRAKVVDATTINPIANVHGRGYVYAPEASYQ